MAIAAGVSAFEMAVHTVREFLGISGLVDPATGMIPIIGVQGLLFVLWWLRPAGRSTMSIALLVTAVVQLVGGAVISVLPLPFLSFEPKQTVSHYLSHSIIGITQIPLIVVPLMQ